MGRPVASTCWWQGTIEAACETHVHLVTRTDLVDCVVALARKRHAYEVPNVTALPIIGGNPDFVARVKSETLAGTSSSRTGRLALLMTVRTRDAQREHVMASTIRSPSHKRASSGGGASGTA
jgi:hypothetical protein